MTGRINILITVTVPSVAVGMALAGHPPHRSRRAVFPHRAPASGLTRSRSNPPCCCAYPVQRLFQDDPVLCPGPALLDRVPLGQLPSLHLLRCRFHFGSPGIRLSLGCFRRFQLRARVGVAIARCPPLPAFVRRLLRYYGAVRLPTSVHHGCTPFGFSMRTTVPCGQTWDLPLPAQRASLHARGL